MGREALIIYVLERGSHGSENRRLQLFNVVKVILFNVFNGREPYLIIFNKRVTADQGVRESVLPQSAARTAPPGWRTRCPSGR